MGPYPFMPMPASARPLSYSDTGVLRAVLMQEEVRYIPDPKSGYTEIEELPSSSEGQASTDGFDPDKRFTGEPSSPLRKCKFDYECEFDPTTGSVGTGLGDKFLGICADKGLLSPAILPVRNTTRKRSNAGESSPFPPAIEGKTLQVKSKDSVVAGRQAPTHLQRPGRRPRPGLAKLFSC